MYNFCCYGRCYFSSNAIFPRLATAYDCYYFLIDSCFGYMNYFSYYFSLQSMMQTRRHHASLQESCSSHRAYPPSCSDQHFSYVSYGLINLVCFSLQKLRLTPEQNYDLIVKTILQTLHPSLFQPQLLQSSLLNHPFATM